MAKYGIIYKWVNHFGMAIQHFEAKEITLDVGTLQWLRDPDTHEIIAFDNIDDAEWTAEKAYLDADPEDWNAGWKHDDDDFETTRQAERRFEEQAGCWGPE